jgi:GTP:adenosylcobinamide-phosphate guanylyltransferase
MIDAVVLAGGEDRGEIAAQTGIVHRPLLEVAGRPLVQSLLAALRGAAEIGRVALVAPDPVQAVAGDEAVDIRVPDAGSFIDNLERGVEAAAGESDYLLVITGDLPLITPAAVNDLVQQSLASRADACYPIIPKQSCERQFPEGRRTYVRLREGTFTGGNGVVLRQDFVQLRRDLIHRLYLARKNPVKLASMFGLGFVIGLAMGRLSLPQLEVRASALIGGRVAAIISTYPELGFDVDKMADLYLARRVADSFRSP